MAARQESTIEIPKTTRSMESDNAASFASPRHPEAHRAEDIGQKVFETLCAIRLIQQDEQHAQQAQYHLGQLSSKWLKEKRQPQIYLSNGIVTSGSDGETSSKIVIHAMLPENTQYLHLQTPPSGFGNELMCLKDAGLNIVLDVTYPSPELVRHVKLEPGALATPAMWTKMSRRMALDFLRYWDDHVPQDATETPGPTLSLHIDRGDKKWPAAVAATRSHPVATAMAGSDRSPVGTNDASEPTRPTATTHSLSPHGSWHAGQSRTSDGNWRQAGYRTSTGGQGSVSGGSAAFGRRGLGGQGSAHGSEHGGQHASGRYGQSVRSAPSVHGSSRSDRYGGVEGPGEPRQASGAMRARVAMLEQRVNQMGLYEQVPQNGAVASPAQFGLPVAYAPAPSVSQGSDTSRSTSAYYVMSYNAQGAPTPTPATVDMSKAVPLSYLASQNPQMAYAGYAAVPTLGVGQAYMQMQVPYTQQQAMMAYAAATGQVPASIAVPTTPSAQQ